LLFQQIVCQNAGLGETIHPFPDLNVDSSVRADNGAQVVCRYYFFWDDVQVWAHILVVWQWSVEVEVGQVNAKEECSGHINCQVDEQFGGCEIGGWRGFVVGVVNSIALHCQAGAILFLLLGAKLTDNPAIRGLFIGRDLMKKHMFVPFRSHIPWNRHRILFVKVVSHSNFVVGFLTRCGTPERRLFLC
jgi:hypothetical protein